MRLKFENRNSKVRTPRPSHDEQASNMSSETGFIPRSSARLTDSMKRTVYYFQKSNRHILHIIPQVLNDIEQEWQSLTRHINYLEAELEECHAQIFKSLPIDGVSDTWIMGEYSLLRENISNWLEGLPEIDNFLFEIKMKRDDIAIRGSPALFPEGFAAAQSEVLTHIISKYLYNQVFEVLVFGAPPADLQLLESLHHGMSFLKPEKDINVIISWKSDTLRTYTSRQGYEDQLCTSRTQLTEYICEYLDKEFSFVGPIDWTRKAERFMVEIAKPAAELAVKMSCTPDRYHWNWYFDSELYIKGVVRRRDMGNFTIVDALTHQKVRPTKFKDMPDHAKIGDLLLVMYPALFRCGKEGKKDIQIEKAVILIRVNFDSGTTKNKSPLFGGSLGFKGLLFSELKTEDLDEGLIWDKRKYEGFPE